MRKSAILATAAMALALAGCMGGGGQSNRGLTSVHQPVVTQHNFAMDLPVDNGDISPTDQQRVLGWFDAMGVRYGDRVSVDESAVGGARPTRDTVHELLTRRGMMLSDNAPITPGAIAPGFVRVIISRSSARVDGCPNWRTRSAIDYGSTTTSNYGCASNANLAAMVADPLDLVRGQSTRSNDPMISTNAVNGFRARASQSGGSLPANDGGVRGTVNTGREVGGANEGQGGGGSSGGGQ